MFFSSMMLSIKHFKQYTADFITQILYYPIRFSIIYFLWTSIFTSGFSEAGYRLEDLLGYYFILAVLQSAMMSSGVVAFEEWYTINSGELTLYLVKPFHYCVYVYARKLGEFLFRLVLGLFFLISIKYILQFWLELEIMIVQIPLFLFSAWISFSIMIALFQIIGHITFWTENILSLRDNLWNVIRIFSGEIIPVTLFPVFIRGISEVLPFRYIYFLPVSVLQGRFESSALQTELFRGIVWGILLTAGSFFLWGRGVKRYTAQGG